MKRSPLFSSAIILSVLFGALLLTSAKPRGNRLFSVEGGIMMVFPGDSINLASLTYIVDGDTVDRRGFLSVDRHDIYSLTVTKGPANCIELTTVSAMTEPLESDTLASGVRMTIDGVTADASLIRSIPTDSIRRVTMIKGPHPALIISTRPDSSTSN